MVAANDIHFHIYDSALSINPITFCILCILSSWDTTYKLMHKFSGIVLITQCVYNAHITGYSEMTITPWPLELKTNRTMSIHSLDPGSGARFALTTI